MSNLIHFAKMQGAGNDYIYVDTSCNPLFNASLAAQRWSAPHMGVGSDGLVLIGRAEQGSGADFTMRIFNADGSEALMCGNASRCIGKYVYEKGLTTKREIRLETRSGVKTLTLHLTNDEREVSEVTVDMLAPQLDVAAQFVAEPGASIEAGGRRWAGTFVSMGNPHYVVFVEGVEQLDIARYGALLEHADAFPERTNVEFCEVLSDGRLRMRVWERGSGITLACGTGACATAVAACLTGRASRESRVVMDGGELAIAWRKSDGHVLMTGPAAFVYEGEIALP